MSGIIHKETAVNDIEIYLICKKMENLFNSGMLSLIPELEFDPMGVLFLIIRKRRSQWKRRTNNGKQKILDIIERKD